MTRFTDEVIDRKATFFVPGGPKGPSTVTERKGYVLRERGDVDGRIAHEYMCPEHGRFTAMVSRRDVPDEGPCPAVIVVPAGVVYPPCDSTETCGLTSPWSPSTVGVGKSSGEVTC